MKALSMSVGKAMGSKAGRCRHVQISELFSRAECNHAVIDFLADTEVGKFTPKGSLGMERTQGSGLRSGIGGNGVIPFFPSFSYLSFINRDQGSGSWQPPQSVIQLSAYYTQMACLLDTVD